MPDVTKEQAVLLKGKKIAELREIAKAFGLKNADAMKKKEILDALLPEDAKQALEEVKAETRIVRRVRKSTEEEAPYEAEETEKADETDSEKATETDRDSDGMIDSVPDFLLAGSALSKTGSLRFRRAESIEKAAMKATIEDDFPAAHEPEKAPLPPSDTEYEDTVPAFLQRRKMFSPDAREPRAPYDATRPRAYAPTEDRPEVEGILEVTDSGYGFLRFDKFRSSDKDVYVSQIQIRRFNLKTGDKVKGIIRKPDAEERFGAILFVREINGDEPGISMRRTDFEELTPTYPTERLRLASGSFASNSMLRFIDLLTPIGKGTRSIIAAPPKTGKTDVLKSMAISISENHPECEVIVLLVAERPEEITDLTRAIKGDVVSSSFDEAPAVQIKLAEIGFERARRLAEHKKDVVVLLDSLPRLVRAYNYVVPPSGRVLAGGLDPAAFIRPKTFFGSARKLEEGGSVTVVAVAGTETLSRTDDFILEEFRGTANMELLLERKITETGIANVIKMEKSMTKRDSLLLSAEELAAAKRVRFEAAEKGVSETSDKLKYLISQTRDNLELSKIINKQGL